MRTNIYVTELAYLNRKRRLVEDTPPIDTTAETGPAPGPDPATPDKEKPAPDSAVKSTNANKKAGVEKQAFVGGALSHIGSQLLQKAYGVVSGDIFHKPQGRVGNNPAYTGAGTGR